MSKNLILTFIADDKPGLVQRIAQTTADNGGNWLDSRMAHLAGKFAGVAQVEVDAEKLADLKAALEGLGVDGFHLAVEEATAESTEAGQLFELELLGPDQPGIVRDISNFLADRGISVEEMATDIRDAPHAGGTLFYAHSQMRAPQGFSDEAFREALDELADELMVDISLGKVL